jgi:hypothetical protein
VIYSVNRDGMEKYNIYYAAWNDYVRAFQVTNGMLALSSHSVITLAFPGATPSVSANGTGNGIVWIIQVNVPSGLGTNCGLIPIRNSHRKNFARNSGARPLQNCNPFAFGKTFDTERSR